MQKLPNIGKKQKQKQKPRNSVPGMPKDLTTDL